MKGKSYILKIGLALLLWFALGYIVYCWNLIEV